MLRQPAQWVMTATVPVGNNVAVYVAALAYGHQVAATMVRKSDDSI